MIELLVFNKTQALFDLDQMIFSQFKIIEEDTKVLIIFQILN